MFDLSTALTETMPGRECGSDRIYLSGLSLVEVCVMRYLASVCPEEDEYAAEVLECEREMLTDDLVWERKIGWRRKH